MLREITLGQFYPADSVLHRLDPRVKLLSTLIFLVEIFISVNVPTFIFTTFILIILIAISKVPFTYMIRGLKAIMILLVIAGLFNLFLTPGEIVWSFGKLSITRLGIKNAAIMVIRMTYLIIGSSLLTLTTTPGQLTEGLEKGLGFLKIFSVPVHEIAMMMSIALRFIPILIEEADKIMKAQISRGADLESGNILKRAKNMVPILVPLFVSAFRRANDLALAMEARCYNGGEGRTKMYPLKYETRDKVAYFLIFLSLIVIIVLRILFIESLFKNIL